MHYMNTFFFIVDGMWGQWAAYGQCSRTCGSGTKKRQRLCNKPTPLHGGLFCPGLASQTVRCIKNPCPTSKYNIHTHNAFTKRFKYSCLFQVLINELIISIPFS